MLFPRIDNARRPEDGSGTTGNGSPRPEVRHSEDGVDREGRNDVVHEWKVSFRPDKILERGIRKFIREVILRKPVAAAIEPVRRTPHPEWPAMRAKLIADRKFANAHSIDIMTPAHTLYVAHLLQNRLEALNFKANILTGPPEKYEADLYFAICPQMFSDLPPREKLICFQMEQSVSSRWFTADYFNILKDGLAVADYSRRNAAFLDRKGIAPSSIYHLPVAYIPDYPKWLGDPELKSSGCDVLFYGDDRIPRRRKILSQLQRKFDLRVIRNVFGEDLRQAIRGARVVLNVHYYEDALLETTRIYESLSLNARVVSEEGSDQSEHAELNSVVDFVPKGDVDAMIAAIERLLRMSKGAHSLNTPGDSTLRFDMSLQGLLRELGVQLPETSSRASC
ncbi:hypothetical protein [Terrihabitans sp. B22-R8]|uniref:hypothetical protein n=1 Tax=Terrihabitans sp. B22-R8 TaxID=3425128 RepID=UPI00403C1731